MKQYVLFSVLFLSLGVTAQTLSVDPHDKHLSSSDLWMEMVTEINVKNISTSETIDVKVSKEVLNATPSSSNYFCWVNCFLPATMVSPTTIQFAPGDENDIDFSVHFTPNGDIGQSAIKYCAFDADNPSDSACTIIYFNATSSSLDDEVQELSFSDFHPNPTSSNTEMNFNLLLAQHAEVVVLDMLGNLVKKHQLSGDKGRLTFTVTDLKAGLYFANIMVDGQLHEIKRLIVSE